MKVIGIDPGTARMGWAIVEGNQAKQTLIACGCLETESNSAAANRLMILHRGLTKILEEFKPDVAAVEDLFFFKNAKTVIKVAEARGMVLTLMKLSGLEVFNYTPLQVKQTITGYGRAEKTQVELMVKSMLKITTIIKPDDAADAVAIGLTHLIFNQMLRK
jgi:crossover junction endodeoxyribonuclease RuvC